MLAEWKEKRFNWIATWISAEAPIPGRHCTQCGTADSMYRCMDCWGTTTLCKGCCLSTHHRDPWHRIQVWKTNHYASSDLHDLGFVMHLGHRGETCPHEHGSPKSCSGSGTEEDEPEWTDMAEAILLVVGLQGVVHRTMRWCVCPDAKSREDQLLDARLMPATSKRTKTVFTFDLLEDFHLSRLECNTSAMNYYQKLRRLTNNAFQNDVPVCNWTVSSILVLDGGLGSLP